MFLGRGSLGFDEMEGCHLRDGWINGYSIHIKWIDNPYGVQ